jgi:hypothetical protein
MVLCSTAALALSVSPASILFDTPGRHEFTIAAHNDGEAGTLSVRAQGDLADRITFVPQSSELDDEVTFHGTIDIPDNMVPGDHAQELILMLQGPRGGTVGASVEVTSLLVARKAYAGPYLSADIYAAPDNGLPDTTNLFITLENKGDAAVTPKITLVRESGVEVLQVREIAPRSSERFTAVLHGRGEENMSLIVEGAQGLRKEFSAAVGHPLITGLRAYAIPDSGSITPIAVAAEVSWNRPVNAKLIIAGKQQDVIIDRELNGTFYAETNETTIPVTLIVGTERHDINITAAASPVPVQQMRWEWLVLLVILVLLAIFLYAFRRSGRKVLPADAGGAAAQPVPANDVVMRSTDAVMQSTAVQGAAQDVVVQGATAQDTLQDAK